MGRVPESAGSVAELAARYQLCDSAVEKLTALLELVSSDPLAPTSVRDPRRVLDDHLADSLVALELEHLRAARTIADLGAGAGFPGLPLAIALPDAELALIESSGRKCAFIARAIAVCGATNARVVHTRAESWEDGLGTRDLVTARALAAPEVVLEYAAPLLRVGGSVAMWRGRRDPTAEAVAAAAAAELGLELSEVRAVHPYPRAAHRHLHVMSKLRATPPRFPRRPGIAQKRPLGHRPTASDRARR